MPNRFMRWRTQKSDHVEGLKCFSVMRAQIRDQKMWHFGSHVFSLMWPNGPSRTFRILTKIGCRFDDMAWQMNVEDYKSAKSIGRSKTKGGLKNKVRCAAIGVMYSSGVGMLIPTSSKSSWGYEKPLGISGPFRQNDLRPNAPIHDRFQRIFRW